MFSLTFTAQVADIDELGHVNNAVWVRWMETLAVAHWRALASAEEQAALIWVVSRHEIDYRGNLRLGETVTGETWVPDGPRGARFDRHARFVGEHGRVKVAAVTTWALLDRGTGRLSRVRPELAKRFLSTPNEQGQ